MPELPEVNAYSIIVAKCCNAPISAIDIIDPRVIKKVSAVTFKKNLLHNSFTKVERKGKYLVITLASKKILIMHFGLTGFVDITKPGKQVRFTCVNFNFERKKLLHWADVRKFGKLYLVDTIDAIPGVKDLGTDALALTFKEFCTLCTKYPKKNIKGFLMQQSLIAGIGNEYSDEILFQAGVDPHHSIKDLSPARLKNIYSEIKKVLKYAIGVRKKDISQGDEVTMSDVHDFKSSYLQAHRHTDGKCPHNPKHALKHATIAGRTSYYCPVDQK